MERVSLGLTHPQIHQSDAVVAGPLLFTSALMADDGKQGIPAEARTNPGYPYLQPEIKLQTRYILRKLGALLKSVGADFSHVVKAHGFITDPAEFSAMDEAWGEFFETKISRTFVSTPALPVAGARVCFDFIACLPGSGVEVVRGNAGTPPAFTRKVEATRVGDLIFTSGQLGYDSRVGFPPEARRDAANPALGPDVVRQSRYTIANLGKSIASVGGSGEHLAKAQVYLTDASNHSAFMADWRQAFSSPPADTVVGAGLFVPEGLIEIDLTGYRNRKGLVARAVGSGASPKAFQVGEWIFASGLWACDQRGLLPMEATLHPTFPNYGSSLKLQARYILRELARNMEEAGADLGAVTRAAVFLTDLRDFAAMDEVWREFFPKPPARTVVTTPYIATPGARIAIDVMGYLG